MQTYTIVLTLQELSMIAQGLAELPYKYAAPVIGKLDEQIKAQSAPAPESVNGSVDHVGV